MASRTFFNQTVTRALLMLSSFWVEGAAAQGTCVTADLPNPIVSVYPNNVTGVLNTTLVVIPIPLETARQIVPKQYGILTGAYTALLPSFPWDMYPIVFQGGHDHDIHFQNFGIPDFNRAGFMFPFIDVLQDGYSSFMWTPSLMVDASNAEALAGSEAHGIPTFPTYFDPPCNAYAGSPFGNRYLNGVSANATGKRISLNVSPVASPALPDYISFLRNVTNQPTSGNFSQCDLQIRLFNTSVSQAPYQPVMVHGSLEAVLEPFPQGKLFDDIFGIQVDTAFIENNGLECASLKGYQLSDQF